MVNDQNSEISERALRRESRGREHQILFTAIQYELFREFLPQGFCGLAFDDCDDDQGHRIWEGFGQVIYQSPETQSAS